MIKYFAKKEVFIVLLIPIMVLAHLLLDIYFPSFNLLAVGQENMLNIKFYQIDPTISRILAFIFICVNAILLNFLFNTHEFYDRNIFLPSLFYILLVFLFPMSLRFGEDLIGHTFFILSLNQVLNIKQNEDARNKTFLAGFFIGLATIFLPVYIFFIVVVWIGTKSIRPFVLREYVLPLVGIVLSLMWTWLWNPEFYQHFIAFNSTLDYSRFGNIVIYIPHAITLILLIWANKQILDRRSKSSIRYKRIIAVVIYMLLFALALSVAILIFFDTYFYFAIGVAILPLILPYAYLGANRKWLPAIFIYILLVLNIIKFLY